MDKETGMVKSEKYMEVNQVNNVIVLSRNFHHATK